MGIFRPQQAPAGASVMEQAQADARNQMLGRLGFGLLAAAIPQTAAQRTQALQQAFGGMGDMGTSVYNNAQLRIAQQKMEREQKAEEAQARLLQGLGQAPSIAARLAPVGAPVREGGFASQVAPVQSMAPVLPAPQGDIFSTLTPAQIAIVRGLAPFGAAGAVSKAVEFATANLTPKKRPEPIKIKVGDKEILVDAETFQPVYQPPAGEEGLDKEKIKIETDIRKEFQALPAVKSFPEAQRSYSGMLTAAQKANQGGKTQGVYDTALVFGFFKTIDPTSTVREGEYAALAASQGLPASIVSQMQRLDSGGFLTPEFRNTLVEVAGQRLREQLSDVKSIYDQYSALASRYNLKPEEVISMPRVIENIDMPPGVLSVEED